MKKIISILLCMFLGSAIGSDQITVPAEGFASAESIIKCESQLAKLNSFQRIENKTGIGYSRVTPGSESFVYFFTTPADRAHPAMIRITMSSKFDVRNPQESEVKFLGSYASKEKDFRDWSARVVYDFGRGLATGSLMKN